MSHAVHGDIELFFENRGPASGRPLLMIMGYSSQLIHWDSDLVAAFQDAGFQVIVFDNRDAGLSTKLSPGSAYTLDDMAGDSFAVLDAAGIEAAHVFGLAMGGMIGQVMALSRPDRVLSLVSAAATTSMRVGRGSDDVLTKFLAPRPTERESYADYMVELRRMLSTPELYDAAWVRRKALEHYDRCYYPDGMARQWTALDGAPDRTEALKQLRTPTLALHGELDPLITADGARATAAAIPDAELLIIDGMAHELPRRHWPTVVAHTARLAGRAAETIAK